jgi:transglutaminase-like putative cysteine protease
LLIVAFALKLVEMRSRRDAYLVIFLCYFVIATEFLFEQSIAIAAYELLAVILVTAAMVGLNQMHSRIRPLVSLRTAAVLVLQAAPLMLVLFLFFPRLAPLWSVPLPGGAQTGITDRVAPGDIASLTRSDEIAFRANFDGPVPAPRLLYWRGMVYSRFDDGVWTAGPLPTIDSQRPGEFASSVRAASAGLSVLSYEVLLEPTQSVWLFALETPTPASAGVFLTRDYRLVAMEPVRGLYRYRVDTRPDFATDQTLPDWLRRRETQLPAAANPRSQAFAAQLAARNPDPMAYLNALLLHIRREPYRYTLSPPVLSSPNDIDEFWFDTRSGFCSHFAGAFVYLARLAGIPARMVGGYQGGEINPVTGHLVVRQYDAHAWAEAWLEGEGWVRFDPTAAVAPARIEQGLDAALSEPDRAALAAFTSLRLGGATIAEVLYFFESLEHRWNVWVVGYDGARQYEYLHDLLGEVSAVRIGLVMLGGGAASLALVALSLFWRRRPVAGHPVERLLRRFSAALARQGVVRAPAESPRAFLMRVASWLGKPAEQVSPLVESLDSLLYNPGAEGDAAATRRRVTRGLRRLKLEAALRNRG